MKDREDRIFLLFTDLLHHTNHYAGGNMEQNRIMVTVPEETKRQLERRWEKAGIGDDFIFSCVMRKEEFFLPLMQRIFPEMKLCRVEKHIPQMTVYGAAGAEKLSRSCQRGETGG